MRLLLDTHIWVWSLLEPSRIVRNLRALLRPGAVELFLSPVSVSEAAMLAQKGRIRTEGDPLVYVGQLAAHTPHREAPLTAEVALRSRALALPHEDPADRFPVATAEVHGLPLVTADEILLAHASCRLLPNR